LFLISFGIPINMIISPYLDMGVKRSLA